MNTMVERRAGAAVHGGLLLAAFAVVALFLPACPWPWYLFLPLLVYGVVAWALPPLRHTLPRLDVGHLGGGPLGYAAALVAATTAALVGFHVLARPDVTALAAKLPVSAFGSLVLAGACFSVVNAILEELVFRGVLWEAVAREWNAAVALGATAVLFGLGHWQGYPSGPLGATMAGVYGVALGLLRWWAGGLGLAVACHVCADATIFSLLVSSGAFDGRAI